MISTLFKSEQLLDYQQRLWRLRIATTVLFLLLFLSVSIISYQGYQQHKQDLVTQYQKQANKIGDQINRRLFKRAALANAAPLDAFNYYQTLYNPLTKEVSKVVSPLSSIEFLTRFPGHMGYFQVDKSGLINSPIWPQSSIDIEAQQPIIKLTDELYKRRSVALEVFEIISKASAIKDLFENAKPLPGNKFDVLLSEPDYYIFYRPVESLGEIKIQGYIIHRETYLKHLLIDVANFTSLDIDLAIEVKQVNKVPYYFVVKTNEQHHTNKNLLQTLPREISEQVIGEQTLNWPYKNHTLTYRTTSLTWDSTTTYGLSLILALLTTILIGCSGLYYLGKRHLKLAEQRLNFVSSVSHQLKTPLTSIRMYSEMLKSGMVASKTHQLEYYDFIHQESERLSRLIDNILQLSSLSRPKHNIHIEYTELSVINDVIKSKLSSLLENSGFALNIKYDFDNPDEVFLLVDMDAFSQVIINITDNAIKFYNEDKISDSSRKKVDFTFLKDPNDANNIVLEIRDYGVGIDPEQENKIFELFYRGGSELTRSTQGTGIGLALVRELVAMQQGTISVKRMKPGIAMKVCFKSKFGDTS